MHGRLRSSDTSSRSSSKCTGAGWSAVSWVCIWGLEQSRTVLQPSGALFAAFWPYFWFFFSGVAFLLLYTCMCVVSAAGVAATVPVLVGLRIHIVVGFAFWGLEQSRTLLQPPGVLLRVTFLLFGYVIDTSWQSISAQIAGCVSRGGLYCQKKGT